LGPGKAAATVSPVSRTQPDFNDETTDDFTNNWGDLTIFNQQK
jgi:hypothetical protein